MITLDALRAYAIARSLFPPTTLLAAIERLGFVQADPIRAPARAQDLTLRHRVIDYRAGDLERRYAELPVEEDFFVNYGFLPRRHLALMLPRASRHPWDRAKRARAARVLAFVRERGEAHPREVEARFGHGTITNYWGGSSNATTRLLEEMHFRGLLRVARRQSGVRVYAPAPAPTASSLAKGERAEALVKLAFEKYAPMPAACIGPLVSRLRWAASDLAAELRPAATRLRRTQPHAVVSGVAWYWPAGEDPLRARTAGDDERVHLLAPFDPVVWDRRRFEAFWGWAYRFEAYTPVAKRKLGYYALPVLFRGRAIGWANATTKDGVLAFDFGWVTGRAPRERAFSRALEAEVERLRAFVTSQQRQGLDAGQR